MVLIRNILLVLIGVVLSLLALVLIVFQWPALLLNEKVFDWAKIDVLQWDDIGVEIEQLGFLHNRILIHAKSFCFKSEPTTKACFDSVMAGGAYDLWSFTPSVTEVGPLYAAGGDIYFKPTEGEDKEQVGQGLPEIPEWFKRAKLQPVEVVIEKFKIDNTAKPLSGTLLVISRSSASGSQTYTAEMRLRRYGSFVASAVSQHGHLTGPWRYEAEAHVARATLKFTATVNGVVDSGRVSGELAAQIHKPAKVRVRDCKYDFSARTSRSAVDLNCVVQAGAAGVRINAHMGTEGTIAADSLIQAEVTASPFTSMPRIVATSGTLSVKASFQLNELPQTETFNAHLNTSVRVAKFQRLVQHLDKSRFAIPAPLHNLKGSLSLRGRGEVGANGGELRATLKSNLTSDHQRMLVNAMGKLKVQMRLDPLEVHQVQAFANVNLDDVQLTLPPVTNDPPGQLFPDSRIRTVSMAELRQEKWSASPKPFPSSYRIDIATPEKPLRLASELSANPIPLYINLWSSSEVPLSGTIKVREFPIQVMGFRREVETSELFVQMTDYRQTITGELGLSGTDDEAQVMYSPKPGESPIRPSPKFALSMIQVASGLAVGFPFTVAVVDPNATSVLDRGVEYQEAVLQFRKRW